MRRHASSEGGLATLHGTRTFMKHVPYSCNGTQLSESNRLKVGVMHAEEGPEIYQALSAQGS